MQIDLPDPTHTDSTRARANFRLAVKTSLGFVALLWLIPLLGWGLGFEQYGIRPREWIGLPGILAAPLLHADFNHLLANTLPLIVLGTMMFHLYPYAAFRVLPAIYLGPGILVWLLARGGDHLGASGLIYGLVGYIFVAGLIRHDRRAVAGSMIVAFMYGSLIWGVLPVNPRYSWETHLAAAVIGVVMAVLLRHRDLAPRVRYSWEDESARGEGADFPDQSQELQGEYREVPAEDAQLIRPRTLH